MQILLQQNSDTIKSYVQLLFDSLKNEIESVKRENTEIKRSLEFTQSELREAQTTIREQRRLIEDSNDGATTEIRERVRELEDYSRRNNLILDGIPERSGETNENLQVAVVNIFKEKMNVNANVEIAHRLGRSGNPNHNPSRPRQVIVKMRNFSDRQACIRSASKLKGTNIYINEDLSRASLEIRKTRLPELQEKRRQGLIAYFSGTKIITKQRAGSSGQEHKNARQESKYMRTESTDHISGEEPCSERQTRSMAK